MAKTLARHAALVLISGFFLPFLSVPARAACVPAPANTLSCPRFGHTAALMTDGNILVCGGQDAAGDYQASCELSLEQKGRYKPVGSLINARSSHTATLLPSGKLLLVGGLTAAGAQLTAANSAEIYDPRADAWSLAGAGGAFVTPRYNHTATLLKDGTVLICGGQIAGGVPTNDCRSYNPATDAFSAASTMITARFNHSATLTKDGRVFFTGGFNATSNPRFLATSELYIPGTGFVAAHSLINGRAYHTATMMGNGQILIAGGYNEKDVFNNKGSLQNTEIYDPQSDSILPAAPSLARLQSHTATLDPDGSLRLFGGLGNITTTYFNASGVFEAGSFLTGQACTPPLSSTSTFIRNYTVADCAGPYPDSTSLSVNLGLSLAVPVSGIIKAGEIVFSTPQARFPFGFVYFSTGPTGPPATGLKADLAGTHVTCNPACGAIAGVYPLRNIAGYYGLSEIGLNTTANLNPAMTMTWTGGILNASAARDLNPATSTIGDGVTTSITIIGLPGAYVGGKISSGTITLTGGSITTSTSTVTLTGGTSFIPGQPTIVADGNGGGRVTVTGIKFYNLQGQISSQYNPNGGCHALAPDPTAIGYNSGQTLNTAVNICGLGAPVAGALLPMQATFTPSGKIRMVVDRIDMTGQTFTVDIATVIIRSMVFSDVEKYDPKTDAWSFPGGEQGYGPQRYAHTATLVPDGGIRFNGGLSCDTFSSNPGCAATGPVGDGSVPIDGNALNTSVSLIPTVIGWTSVGVNMADARANHTATPLPTGKILLAGGTNGKSVLARSELFDPVLSKYTQTGSLRDARDLHTATLLPNGRVLVAGGFTTNSLSSAPTNSAEIYYPDSGVWRPTANMNFAREQHTATVLPDGNVLVVGGFDASGYLDNAEIYYSTSGVWRPASAPAVGSLKRARHTATLLKDGKVLIAGGINDAGVLKTALTYNFGGGWSAAAAVPDIPTGASPGVYLHSATLLPGGLVLINGGNDGRGEIQLSQLYDPVSNTWSATNNVSAARFNHTTVLLPDGIVLAIGGAQGLNKSVAFVEAFNIGRSSWSTWGGVTLARAYHTTTLSAQGRIYNIGGYDGLNYLASGDQMYFTSLPDTLTKGISSSLRQSSVAAVTPNVFAPGSAVTLTGSNFMGFSEGSGGSGGSASSPHYHPRIYLQSMDGSGGSSSQGNGGFLIDLTTTAYFNYPTNWPNIAATLSSMSFVAPSGSSNVPTGWYHIREANNAIFSDGQLARVGPALPAGISGPVTSSVVSESTISYSWSTTGISADGYNLYYASSAVWISTIAAPPFIMTGLQPNSQAAIIVAPYTLSGDGPATASGSTFTYSTAPASLAITAVSYSNVTLTWSSNNNSTSTLYEVSYSTDNPAGNGKNPFTTSFSTPISVIPVNSNHTTTQATIDNLLLSTTYYFRVRAYNGSYLASNFSAVVSTATRAPLTGLVGQGCGAVNDPRNTTCVQWSWDPGGAGTVFNVYNATSGALIYNRITPNGFQDINLATNSIRSIRVSAVTAVGEGPLSASVTVYTETAVPALVNPSFPAAAITTGSLSMVWGANGNPSGTLYEVTFVSGTTQTTELTHTAQLLTPANLYSASVKSINQLGIKSTTLTLGTTSTLAKQPTSLAVTGTDLTTIGLSWSANGNASTATYQVIFSSDDLTQNGKDPFTTSISTWIPFSQMFTGLSTTITGLKTGRIYWVRVAAQNASGTSTGFTSVSTKTNNGGAPVGSLAGLIDVSQDTVIEGTLGTGRFVSFNAPANAFPSDTTITISSFDVTTPLCADGAGISVDLTVNPPMQPTSPVYLKVSYDPAELGAIDTSQIAFMRYDPVSQKCVPLKTTIDTANRLIIAQLNHLSLFQIALVRPSDTPDTARVFPNPFYTAKDGFVTFLRMPAFSRVRIFTLRGDMVYDQRANGSGLLTWTGVNSVGRAVASGTYVATVESAAELPRKIVKVVVIR